MGNFGKQLNNNLKIKLKRSLKGFLKQFQAIIDKWYTRYVLTPLLSVFFPNFALYYFKDPSVKKWVDLHFSPLSKILNANPALSISFMLASVAIFPSIIMLVDDIRKSKRGVTKEALQIFLRLIDDVVGHKCERFGSPALTVSKNGNTYSPGDVFLQITQPEIQISKLVESALLFFQSSDTDNDNEFRIRLIEVKDKKPIRFSEFFPKDKGPTISIEDLDDRDSSVCHAITRKKVHIIPDIRKEGEKPIGKRSYKPVYPLEEDEDGSLVCYPIVHRQFGVIYVLCLCSSKNGYLNKAKAPIFETVLGRVSKRICLEHSLKVLKEGVQKLSSIEESNIIHAPESSLEKGAV